MPSLSDLLRMGKQYISDALPGGSLNPEVSRQSVLDGAAMALSPVPLLGDLVGLGADANRYATDPESRTPMNYGLTALGALPFVPGMTAWHGSPHKFDKFSLDKIGTGEGAQAYGHGLYLAENKGVGEEYAKVLTKNAFFDGKPIYEIDPNTIGRRDTILSGVINVGSDARGAIPGRYTPQGMDSSYDGPIAAMKALIESGKVPKNATKWLDESGNIKVSSVEPQLYKTDIPDEAVARFLDWDKPIAMQEPHIKDALKKALGGKLNPDDFYSVSELASHLGYGDMAKGSDALKQSGIPGIRYLDGGSRSAGQGSSNFVVFDPEMIRILERNGVPTGQKPWNPNEYRPLSDLMNPRID